MLGNISLLISLMFIIIMLGMGQRRVDFVEHAVRHRNILWGEC